MTGPVASPGAVSLPPSVAPPPAPTPGSSASLLPAPAVEIGSIESLYALMVEAGRQEQQTGRADVEQKFENKRVALERYKAEVAEAREEEGSGGIFGTLATVAVGVAAAAATVCTLGAAAPALVGVGLALSSGGFFVEQTRCFGRDASQWIGMGMQLGGAAITCGASSGSSIEALETLTDATQCASAVTQGAHDVDSGLREARADEHTRTAKRAEHEMHRLQRAIDDVIARLEESKGASGRASQTVYAIVEAKGQTLLIAAGGRA